MFSPILNPDQLQALQKAADSLSKSDKQKEKMMDEIRLNGKEWNGISAGREEVGIPKPKKVLIEDLAEKAKIINESRDIVYQLQQNKAFAEMKQKEFFEKQAQPVSKAINDSAAENKKQLDMINESLEEYGLSDEKIAFLQQSIRDIVDAVDYEDEEGAVKQLVDKCIDNITRLPSYKNDGVAIRRAIMLGLVGWVAAGAKEEELPRDGPPSSEATAESTAAEGDAAGESTAASSEAKAESKSSYDPDPDTVDDIFKKYERDTSKVLKSTTGKTYENIGSLTNNIDKLAKSEGGINEAERDYLKLKMAKLYYDNPAIMKNETEKNKRKIKKYMNSLIKNIYPNAKMAEAIDRDATLSNIRISGRGMRIKGTGFGKPIREGFRAPTFQDFMSKSNDKLLKQTISQGKGVKSFLSGSGHKKSLKIEDMNNQELMKALTLNIASQKAGNSGVGDMINATIDEMLRRKLIKKAEHKKLWYQFCG